MTQATISGEVRNASAELFITICGIASSVAVAIANVAIARLTGINILSFSLWFILPAGAFAGGMAAASGYYFGAVKTHSMPGKRFLFEMVAIGASTWFLTLFLEYATLTLSDGTAVSSLVSFVDYFKFQAEHQSLTITNHGARVGETGELGALGYGREALQLLGFLAGGFAIWAFLADREKCDGCRRYAKIKKLLVAAKADRFDEVINKSGLVFPGLVEQATARIGNKSFVGLDLALMECPMCHRQWARPALVLQRGNSSPDRTRLGAYAVTAEQAEALSQAVK